MTKILPSLFSYSIDNISKKIEDMVSLGYSRKQVLEMTLKFPGIYSSTIENICEKKEFYDYLGIGNIIVLDPKKLMQSVELSYARYMYYQSIGVVITSSNYSKLFIGQKLFEKRYGKNNSELIDEFNYDSDAVVKTMISRTKKQ